MEGIMLRKLCPYLLFKNSGINAKRNGLLPHSSHTLSSTQSHAHTQSLTHSLTHTPNLSHSPHTHLPTLIFSHTHLCTLIRSHIFSRILSHTFSYVPHTHSYIHSHPLSHETTTCAPHTLPGPGSHPTLDTEAALGSACLLGP